MPSPTMKELMDLTKVALVEEAEAAGVTGYSSMNKTELSEAIIAEDKESDKDKEPEETQDDQVAPTAYAETLLEDIRVAHASGAKIVRISEGDPEIQAEVERFLSEDECGRVCWGSSQTSRHVVG